MEADSLGARVGDSGFRSPPAALIVTLLFLFAVALRSAAAVRTVVMFNDGPIFLELAEYMGRGEWTRALSHHYHPLYSFAIFVFHFATGDWELAALLISIVSGSAAVVALYFLLRHAFDAATAWVGSLLLALVPYAVTFSADIQSEGLYLALFMAAVACLWRALQLARVGLAGVAGSLAGLAYLTRPEGIGVVAVGAGLAGLVAARRGWSWRRGVSWSAALVLGAAVVAGPYVVFLRVEKGEWMLTQKKSLSSLVLPVQEETAPEPESPPDSRSGQGEAGAGREPQGDPAGSLGCGGFDTGPKTGRGAEGSRALASIASVRAAASAYGAPASPRWARRSALRRLLLVCVSALWPPVIFLLGAGLYACRGRPGLRGLFILAFLSAYGAVIYGLAHNVGYVTRRHALPPLVPLLGYAAMGVPIVGDLLLRGAPRLSCSPLLRGRLAVWSCLVLVAVFSLPKALALHRGHELAARRAAEWLGGRPELTGPVAAEKRRIAYYAGEQFVGFQEEGEDVDASLLYRRGARFLIVDEQRLGAYAKLRNARGSELRTLYRVEAAGRRAVVLELRAPE